VAVVFALEHLFNTVKPVIESSFTASGRVLVPVVWGRGRPPSNLDTGALGRVVFVPGAPNGDVGPLENPKHWPQPARPLQTLMHQFHVYVYGRALREKSVDVDHDHAAFRVLHEVLRQIRVYSTDVGQAGSPVIMRNPQLLKATSVGNLGREYLVPGVIEQPILDALDDDFEYVDVAPANADISDSLGNRTEHSEA
jgi:hypothetical protein